MAHQSELLAQFTLNPSKCIWSAAITRQGCLGLDWNFFLSVLRTSSSFKALTFNKIGACASLKQMKWRDNRKTFRLKPESKQLWEISPQSLWTVPSKRDQYPPMQLTYTPICTNKFDVVERGDFCQCWHVTSAKSTKYIHNLYRTFPWQLNDILPRSLSVFVRCNVTSRSRFYLALVYLAWRNHDLFRRRTTTMKGRTDPPTGSDLENKFTVYTTIPVIFRHDAQTSTNSLIIPFVFIETRASRKIAACCGCLPLIKFIVNDWSIDNSVANILKLFVNTRSATFVCIETVARSSFGKCIYWN